MRAKIKRWILIACQLLLSVLADDKMLEISRRLHAERELRERAPPEAEASEARRSRLVASLNLSQGTNCNAFLMDITRKALARTFAIYCAKNERRSLGK